MQTKTSATPSQPVEENKEFLEDILTGLAADKKRLPSKYFYDAEGDLLFQQLMAHPAYYLTDCESEIFTKQTHALANAVLSLGNSFNLVELGAGDATKSVHLLQELISRKANYHYIPIDISTNIIQQLQKELPLVVPGLKMTGYNGEYFKMLNEIRFQSDHPKAILFLGSNIGNMYPLDAHAFLRRIRSYLTKGDIVILGFDLKKHPAIIRRAYDDPDGITAQFNINLLKRINRELEADFQIDQFEHYCSYDPETGACKSYLISLKDMQVSIGQSAFTFHKNEYIWMEISQKYTMSEIDSMAPASGFSSIQHITDDKGWFTDTVWKAV